MHKKTKKEAEMELAEEIKNELTVDKSSLSKTRNEKISAPDPRASSGVTGYLAIAVSVVVIGLIVLSDITVLFRCPCCLRKEERNKKEENSQKTDWSRRPLEGNDFQSAEDVYVEQRGRN